MADKIVAIKFEVNSADAVEDINKVTKATDGVTAATSDYEDQLNDTKKASDSFKGSSKQFEDQLKSNSKATEAASLASNSFEEQLKEIKKTIDGANVDELEDAIKQYKNIAIIAGQTSPIGREAIMEASALKDKIEDLETAVSIAQRSGTQLQGALQLGSGIAAGYGAVQGVMALVGSESEDLQKTLVKLQAVQATLASVEEIRAVLQKESAFMITATTVAEKARAAATAVSTFVTNGATLSLKAFRVALIGTGIGAIVVVLIAAADAMGLFGESTDDAAKKVEDLNKRLEKQSDLTKKLNEDIDQNTKVQKLKAQIAGKTEAEIIQIEKDAQAEKTKNLYNYYLQTQKANDSIKANQKASAEDRLTFLKNEQDAYNTWQNSVNETLIINLEKEKELADKAREAEKAAEDKRKADLKKAADDRRAKEKEWQSELQADKDKLAADEKTKADKKLADDQQAALIRADLLAADLAGEKASADSKKAYDQEVYDTKIMLAWQGANLINQLMELTANKSKANAERAFKINKAYQLAVAINDGYKAVLSTYAETKGGPVLKGIAAALAGGFAAVQIAKISQSKFDSTKFDNTKAPGSDLTAAAPTQTQAPQTPGRVSNLTGSQTTTVKAIVVESDITTTQKRINSIQELAKI